MWLSMLASCDLVMAIRRPSVMSDSEVVEQDAKMRMSRLEKGKKKGWNMIGESRWLQWWKIVSDLQYCGDSVDFSMDVVRNRVSAGTVWEQAVRERFV